MIIFLFLIGVPLLVTLIEFFGFLFRKKSLTAVPILRLTEVASFLILPYIYLSLADKNDCCGDTATFSPEHRVTIYVAIAICCIAYFYSSYRQRIATPVLETLVNGALTACLILDVIIALHVNDSFLVCFGNLPIFLLTILALVKNHQAFLAHARENHFQPAGKFERIAWKLLTLPPFIKYPVVFILCLPVLMAVSALLLLFGQKPDSFVRAFTETYRHGFSQWDFKCDNVHCGDHYLCSVAANGHPAIVKPQRRGLRNGHPIICNRQLLVSNAFEDLIREKLPRSHTVIRSQYDKVGRLIHRYYGVFSNKFVADAVYILMKPLEWFFILVLYAADRKPENRIAKQYISNADRLRIDAH